MKITPTLPTPPALTPAGRSFPASSWKTGQTLSVTVVDVSNTGKVLLRVGGEFATTEGKLPLLKGQSFQAQITTSGKVPVLQILPPTRSAEEVINNTLRQLLPRQQPIAQTLTTLVRLITPSRTQSVLPAEILHLIKQLVSQLPSRSELTGAAAIRNAAQESGALLESKLANSDGSPKTQTDVKAQILRLLQSLEQWAPKELATHARTPAPAPAPAPATPTQKLPTHAAQPRPGETPAQQPGASSKATVEIAKQQEQFLQQTFDLIKQSAEALLAKTTLNQLQSLRTTERDTVPTLVFELPVRTNKESFDVFRFSISQDEAGGKHESNRAVCSITLEFDLPELGPVRVRVSVKEDVVSTWFWAERPDTVELCNAKMDWLKSDLQTNGLVFEPHRCQLGTLSKPDGMNNGPILDTSA